LRQPFRALFYLIFFSGTLAGFYVDCDDICGNANRRFFKILVWVILGGIVLDMIYFAPVGLNVFAFVTVAFVSNFLARKIFITHGIWTFYQCSEL